MALLTVPGNLLLFCEYAVLEEGGLGIAVAIERRVIVDLSPAPELSIFGRWGAESTEWHPRAAPESEVGRQSIAGRAADERAPAGAGPAEDAVSADGPPDLLTAAVAACDRALLRPRSREGDYPVRLTVDSSALYEAGRAKSGFGSSAAVAVGVTAALLGSAGVEEARSERVLFETSLAAHRTHQGGSGSGYDVATSIAGGMLLFSGGRRPSFRRASLPFLLDFSLVQTQQPVKTPGAIGRYLDWKRRKPQEADRYLRRSNEIIQALLSATSWQDARPAIAEATELGLRLGREIGVPAEIPLPAALEEQPHRDAFSLKALGAGNELGAIWASPGEPRLGTPAPIADRGLSWNE